MSQIVVCDTGPLIHLIEADAIYLLELAGGILIPPAVAAEFKRNLSTSKLPDWIQIHQLNAQSNSQVKTWVEKDYVDIGKPERLGWHCSSTATGC